MKPRRFSASTHRRFGVSARNTRAEISGACEINSKRVENLQTISDVGFEAVGRARQGEPKGLAFPSLAFDADVSPMRAHDLPRDIETQPGSFRPAIGNVEKFFEQPIVILLRDSRPRIRHSKAHRAINQASAQFYRAVMRRVT